MNIIKKDLGKSQIELLVELSQEEFKPYMLRAAEKISTEVKIEGFRPGKVPYQILKAKIGEITILEEAAGLAINKTIDQVIGENITEQIIGQPQITLTKLAPANPLEYKIVLLVMPEIILGNYKSVKVKPRVVEVKEEEVEKIIKQLTEVKAKEVISQQVIKPGDKVIIDIEMFVDQVPVEGGQGKGTTVIIGKDYIIPGFDKKIIGASKGEQREFSLLYPQDFHLAYLAGKLVDFKVKVQEIYQRQLSELNDEFAKDFGLKNLGELKENLKKSLLAEKQLQEEQRNEIVILDKILEQTKFSELPEILISHEVDLMLAELEYQVNEQGGKFEDYLMHLKKTKEQLKLDFLPPANKRAKTSLLIHQIAKLEKIKAEDQEVEQALSELLKQYQSKKETVERIKSKAYQKYLRNQLVSRKVIAKLKEWNVEK